MEQLSLTERYYKERYRKFAENLGEERNAALWPDAARFIARLNNTRSSPVSRIFLVSYWWNIVPRADGSYAPGAWVMRRPRRTASCAHGISCQMDSTVRGANSGLLKPTPNCRGSVLEGNTCRQSRTKIRKNTRYPPGDPREVLELGYSESLAHAASYGIGLFLGNHDLLRNFVTSMLNRTLE